MTTSKSKTKTPALKTPKRIYAARGLASGDISEISSKKGDLFIVDDERAVAFTLAEGAKVAGTTRIYVVVDQDGDLASACGFSETRKNLTLEQGERIVAYDLATKSAVKTSAKKKRASTAKNPTRAATSSLPAFIN
jgi:hypothetical protein